MNLRVKQWFFVHGSTLFEAAGGAPATSFAEGGEVVRLRLLTIFLCCHEAVSCFILEGAVVFAGVAAVGPRGDATEFGSGLH